MTAKIHSDHAFILWSQQVGLLNVYMLAIKQFFFECFINTLLGLCGARKNLLLALKFVLPKVYESCVTIGCYIFRIWSYSIKIGY